MKSKELTIFLHYDGTCVIVFRYLGPYHCIGWIDDGGGGEDDDAGN